MPSVEPTPNVARYKSPAPIDGIVAMTSAVNWFEELKARVPVK
jgi:hypothetical protein